jgi:hypothetical protein
MLERIHSPEDLKKLTQKEKNCSQKKSGAVLFPSFIKMADIWPQISV